MKKRITLFCGLVSFLFLSSVDGSPIPETLDSIEALDRWLRQENIRSLNQVVGSKWTKDAHFTLIHKSQSLQRPDTNPSQPRIVMMLPSGRLSLGFSGNPSGRFFHSLEVLAFDSKRNRFDLARLHFDPQGVEPYQIELNPRVCSGCHGHDPVPLWRGYNDWQGVYGTKDERLEPGTDEHRNYTQFFENRSLRYLSLPWRMFSDLPPYTTGPQISLNLSHRPNSVMGMVWIRQNVKRVLSKILASPEFESRWQELLSLELKCGGSSETLESIFSKLGINREDWSISLTRGTDRPFRYYFDGVTYLDSIFRFALLENLMTRFPTALQDEITRDPSWYSIEKSLEKFDDPNAVEAESLQWAKWIDSYGGFLEGQGRVQVLVCDHLKTIQTSP